MGGGDDKGGDIRPGTLWQVGCALIFQKITEQRLEVI